MKFGSAAAGRCKPDGIGGSLRDFLFLFLVLFLFFRVVIDFGSFQHG
jgi:hypothetical protein